MDQTAAPLDGVRVLDIATFVAAPFAAACLAEFGADVIKIEKPGIGDSLRQLGTESDAGDSYWWLNDARNKRCITLDLKHPRGAELFKRLVADSDVVMENFRPGTLERWGLGFERLREINPGLVMLRVSAYGQEGPKHRRGSVDRVVVPPSDSPPTRRSRSGRPGAASTGWRVHREGECNSVPAPRLAPGVCL